MLIKKITARAKQLQKTNSRLTWQDALKKAGAEFRGKPTATGAKRKVVKSTNTRKKAATKKHTDTKSHNVKINVTSGIKRKPVKFKRAEVDEHALNGIVKIQRGKYYEVVQGTGKGSVFYCKTIKGKPGTVRVYGCRYFEKTGGKLAKPFDVEITDNWLNKRIVKGRGVVRAVEKYGI
jgi:hypothetical protein